MRAIPGCFRWVKPAASLKPSSFGFRRLSSGWWFPLGKTGGLIEASGSQVMPPGRKFPLGKTGGLIEAALTSVGAKAWRASFRWVKPAASLKLDTGAKLRVAHQSFRWVKPAASLKQLGDQQVSGLGFLVSAG